MTNDYKFLVYFIPFELVLVKKKDEVTDRAGTLAVWPIVTKNNIITFYNNNT